MTIGTLPPEGIAISIARNCGPVHEQALVNLFYWRGQMFPYPATSKAELQRRAQAVKDLWRWRLVREDYDTRGGTICLTGMGKVVAEKIINKKDSGKL